MKVLVFLSFKYSFQTWKTAGTFKREMLVYEKLADIYKINFIFITFGNQNDITILEELKNSYFKVIPIFTLFKETKSKFKLLIYSFIVVFKISNLLRSVDLVKFIQLSGSWNIFIIKLICKVPIYIKTGFDAFIFSIKEKRGYFKSAMFYFLTYLGLFNCSIYTASSESDLKVLNKIYPFVRRSKIVLRPNWVDVKKIESTNNRFKSSVLMVGRLEEQKNYEFIIDTFKNTNYKVHIIGSGKLKNYLLDLAEEKNCKIQIDENLDHSDLLSLMDQYEYFLLSSKFEGNPKVLIEAISRGCIPLVSNIPNNKEIVKDGVNGYIFDLETSGKKKIIDILSNYSFEENYKIREEGKKIINKNFSFENYIKLEFDDYMKIKKD